MKRIKMSSVKSSQIESVGYDAETKTLYIEFKKGATYSYANVPQADYDNMLVPTMSVGKYFYAKIKGVFEFKRLVETVEDGVLTLV